MSRWCPRRGIPKYSEGLFNTFILSKCDLTHLTPHSNLSIIQEMKSLLPHQKMYRGAQLGELQLKLGIVFLDAWLTIDDCDVEQYPVQQGECIRLVYCYYPCTIYVKLHCTIIALSSVVIVFVRQSLSAVCVFVESKGKRQIDCSRVNKRSSQDPIQYRVCFD